jgi:hypothetical protein
VGGGLLPDRLTDHRKELQELLREAAEAAKQDYDAGSAVERAEGYTFPPEYVESDVRCLRPAHLDFPVMVRRRLAKLTPDRMNAERVARLRCRPVPYGHCTFTVRYVCFRTSPANA